MFKKIIAYVGICLCVVLCFGLLFIKPVNANSYQNTEENLLSLDNEITFSIQYDSNNKYWSQDLPSSLLNFYNDEDENYDVSFLVLNEKYTRDLFDDGNVTRVMEINATTTRFDSYSELNWNSFYAYTNVYYDLGYNSNHLVDFYFSSFNYIHQRYDPGFQPFIYVYQNLDNDVVSVLTIDFQTIIIYYDNSLNDFVRVPFNGTFDGYNSEIGLFNLRNEIVSSFISQNQDLSQNVYDYYVAETKISCLHSSSTIRYIHFVDLMYYAEYNVIDLGNVVGRANNDFFNFANKFTNALPPQEVDMVQWLITSVGSFMNAELFPGFAIGGIFAVMVAFPLVIWFLKIVLGG